MSKAACLLSFMEDFSDEDAFLMHLAGVLYGRSNAKAVTKAWKHFAEGYKNYPLNIMFSYYGPMHDGIAWELQLKPKNITLPRSWLLLDRPNGDRMGDCLRQSHTLTETIELCQRIVNSWKDGLEALPKGVTGEMETLSKALGLLFESGTNILKFYKLREDLGYQRDDSLKLLSEMRKLVEKEIENTSLMIPLCEKDCRLGYHSEAEECYVIASCKENAKEVNVSDEGSFKAYYDDSNIYLDIKCEREDEVMFCFENTLMVPECEIMVDSEGNAYLPDDIDLYVPLYGDKFKEEYGKYQITRDDNGVKVAANRAKCNCTEPGKPFKLCVKINGQSWKHEDKPVYNLGRSLYSADEFGWVVLEK